MSAAGPLIMLCCCLTLLALGVGYYYYVNKSSTDNSGGTGNTDNSGGVTQPPTQTVYKNSGSVSCNTYCGGTEGRPWNNELPVDWNGAKCSATGNPSATCDSVTGTPIVCTCQKTGTGWNN